MSEGRRGHEDMLAEYLAFARSHAALFENPPRGAFTILLDAEAIRSAEATVARKLQDEGLPPEWARVGMVYEDQYLRILRDAIRFPDGKVGTYIRVLTRLEDGPGVAILPWRKGHVLLLRHFRHATRSWHLEIPRGFGTEGLSSEQSARQELEEEIQAVPSRLISLGPMHTNTGLTSERVELFFAEVESVGSPEAHEAIAGLHPVEPAECEQLIRACEITDSFTICAYGRAKFRGLL